jgi:hypothetical protein
MALPVGVRKFVGQALNFAKFTRIGGLTCLQLANQ